MELVINGGFEIGTVGSSPPPPWSAGGFITISMDNPHLPSSKSVQFSPAAIGAYTLSQNLTTPTIIGATYTFSFWIASSASSNGFITYGFTGSVFPTIPTVASFPYQLITQNVVATNTSTTISFTYNLNSPTVVDRGVSIDDVSVVQVVCFSGDSIVLTKNTINDVESEIEASVLDADTHEVYSVNDQKFIPIKSIVTSGPYNRFMLIQKDALGKNQPNKDFYVTSGHNLMINGIETKARDIPQAKRIKTKPEKLYTICTEKHEPILVNNLPVIAWGHDEWLNKNKIK